MLRIFLITFLVTGLSSCAYDESPKLNLVKNSRGGDVVVPPENCPNWTKFSGTNYSNTPSSNFGCATVTNFGEMIADPQDMISGKSSDLYNAQRTSNSVSAYRNAGAAGGGAEE